VIGNVGIIHRMTDKHKEMGINSRTSEKPIEISGECRNNVCTWYTFIDIKISNYTLKNR
jgi:hypothetical protein